MKNRIVISIMAVFMLAGGLFAFASNTPQPVNLNTKIVTSPTQKTTSTVNSGEYVCVKPLDVVAAPERYLNKKVKFRAVFDKFSTLGLDYKPAFRDSQKYISFLIKRDDVTDHTVPLSEMKIFIKRTEAEKFIDLDSGDVIEVYGKVFSNALTDVWVDTDKLIVIDKKNKDTKKKS